MRHEQRHSRHVLAGGGSSAGRARRNRILSAGAGGVLQRGAQGEGSRARLARIEQQLASKGVPAGCSVGFAIAGAGGQLRVEHSPRGQVQLVQHVCLALGARLRDSLRLRSRVR